ncbi:MAG TPA: polysaccharide biosynthesis protein, partial [Gemmataceae bacterium]|nr:polysaccharide biosynthesis protein [Gemmataceae bacterium]
RCDGTPEKGWEPFYQCLSLAAALQRRRRGTHFFSYLEPLSLATVINRGNNDWVAAEKQLGAPGDLEATIAQVRRLNAAAVVVAGEGMTADYLAELRDTGALVLAFDSAAAITFPVDVLVNPLLAPGRKAYRFTPGTQLLLGHRFALCRGIFRRQRTIRATEQPAPFRGLVAMGDDDLAGQALERSQQLLEIPAVSKVSIAVRSHHCQYEELKDLAAGSNGRVEVVTETKELMTRLVRAHFALTSGDGWAPELCVVGIPQFVLAQTKRHAMSGKRMDDEGVATFLGDAADVSFELLKEAVEGLLDDPMERKGMTRCARNLIDGRGPDRIVNGMEILLHAPSRKRAAQAAAVPQLRIAA